MASGSGAHRGPEGDDTLIRILKDRLFIGDVHYIEAAGLSTDTKPTSGIITGSKFTEVDTGDEYMFAEGDSPSWNKVKSGPTAES